MSTYGTPGTSSTELPVAVVRELARLEGRLDQKADSGAQKQLAGVGEAAALEVLRKIGASKKPVQNLSAYIRWMVNHNTAAEEPTSPKCAFCGSSSPSKPGESGSQHHLGTESVVRHSIVSSPTRTESTPSPVCKITESLRQLGGPSRTREVDTQLRVTASPQTIALGELDFDKVFMMYVYLAGNKIEDLLQEEFIRSLRSLSMDQFEMEIWKKFGHKFVAETDRRKNINWDPTKAKVYHCYVDILDEAIVTIFKGPYIEPTRCHLNKVVGDDNVLIVKFSSIPGITNLGTYFKAYREVAEHGIVLGLRRYRFLIYKDGGKEKKGKAEGNKNFSSSVKCYFVRTESGWDRDEPYVLTNKTIGEARKCFMHIHTVPTVAKYLARFSLILSKTTTLLDADELSNVKLEVIDDIPCRDENGDVVLHHGEPMIHTDGTGLVSEDLAKKCPSGVFKGNVLRTNDLHPLLMQVRIFCDGLAVKGTLLVDRRLPKRTIHIRKSMIKVSPDPNLRHRRSFNSMGIVATSNRPRGAFTSRPLITLLHHGGVPVECFLELLRKALNDVEKSCIDTSDALEVAYNHPDDDSMSARMILSGIQPKDDAYLECQLRRMTQEEREGLKLGRIPIQDSYYLMGTTDPTGSLKPNEVCVIHDNGQLSGEVLVYKNPGLHFGDVHVLTATPIPELEKDYVGISKYAIFFPISGPRSLADEIANSDFDGDMYFVSRNPQLMEHFTQSKPWVRRNPPKKTVQSKPPVGSELEMLLFREFLEARFKPSHVMGIAADSWLAHMDIFLTDKNKPELIKTKILELIEIYYEALDAPKTGNKVDVPGNLMVKKYPHYMGRENSYHSTSVLGRIYDEAVAWQSENIPQINISPLACFTEEVATGGEECMELWKSRYEQYRWEASALYKEYPEEERAARFTELYGKYRRMLYDAAEFDESPRDRREVFHEACAIYQLVYKYARKENKAQLCGFAWKVAGRALCHLHAMKRGGETVLCSHSVLRDAFRRKYSIAAAPDAAAAAAPEAPEPADGEARDGEGAAAQLCEDAELQGEARGSRGATRAETPPRSKEDAAQLDDDAGTSAESSRDSGSVRSSRRTGRVVKPNPKFIGPNWTC